MGRANGVSGVAARLGRGLVAGAIGTAAMTVSSTIEQKRRGREASTAPADAATKVLGIDGFCDDGAKSRFANIVHWSYGTGWGAVRGLLDAAGLRPPAATVAHGVALWGSEQVMLPTPGVASPPWEWGAVEVGIDALHHTVYTIATSVAYEALG